MKLVYAQTNLNNKSYRPEYIKKKTKPNQTRQNPTKTLQRKNIQRIMLMLG